MLRSIAQVFASRTRRSAHETPQRAMGAQSRSVADTPTCKTISGFFWSDSALASCDAPARGVVDESGSRKRGFFVAEVGRSVRGVMAAAAAAAEGSSGGGSGGKVARCTRLHRYVAREGIEWRLGEHQERCGS
jgi:hypothetical protein